MIHPSQWPLTDKEYLFPVILSLLQTDKDVVTWNKIFESSYLSKTGTSHQPNAWPTIELSAIT